MRTSGTAGAVIIVLTAVLRMGSTGRAQDEHGVTPADIERGDRFAAGTCARHASKLKTFEILDEACFPSSQVLDCLVCKICMAGHP